MKVLSYDSHQKKYFVKQVDSGMQKFVDRLSLLFDEEDKNLFKDRVQQCKYYQKRAENEMRFQNYAEEVDSRVVSTLGKGWVDEILSKVMYKRKRTKDDDNAGFLISAKIIIKTVEAEYLREMKKCYVLSEMLVKTHKDKFLKLKIPIRRDMLIVAYYGTIGVLPSMPVFELKRALLEKKLLITTRDNRICLSDFAEKSSEKVLIHMFNYNIPKNQIPLSYLAYSTIQDEANIDANKTLNNLWRESQITTISSVPAFNVSFNLEDYRANMDLFLPTTRFIKRMDLFFRSNVKALSEFNLQKYVDYVRQFNMPIDDEVWSVSQKPLLVITIKNFDIKEKEEERIRIEKEKELQIAGQVLTNKDDKKKKKDDQQKRNALTDEQCIFFEPSEQTVMDTMLKPIRQLIKSINSINTLRSTVLKNLDRNKGLKNPIYEVSEETPAFKLAIEQVQDLVHRAFAEPTKIINEFRKHSELIRKTPEELVKQYLKRDGGDSGKDKKSKKSVEDLDALIQSVDSSISDIQGICINEKNTIFFLLQTAENKKTMTEKAKEIKTALLTQVKTQNEERVSKIKEQFDDLLAKVNADPKNAKDYDDLVKILDDAEVGHEKVLEKLESQIEEVGKYFDLLIKYNRVNEFYRGPYFWYWALMTFPSHIKAAARSARQHALKSFDEFQKKAQESRIDLSKAISDLEKQFEESKKFTFEEWESKSILHDDFQTALDQAQRTKAELNRTEELLGLEPSAYENLIQLVDKNEPYKKMRMLAVDFEGEQAKWEMMILMKLKYKEVSQKVDSINKELNSLQRRFELMEEGEEAAKICGQILNKISSFRVKMPLIRSLTKDALTNKLKSGANPYWQEIMATTGLREKKLVQQQITLMQLINDHHILQHLPIIEEICNRAEREYSLEQKYNEEIIEILKKQRMSYMEHKNTGTYIITGVDELMQLLDEKLTLLIVMKQNPNIKPIKGEVEKQEKKLRGFQDMFDDWVKCQRDWIYLEPIFSSDEIKVELPDPSRYFEEVDRRWRSNMNSLKDDNLIFEYQDPEKLYQSLKTCNELLDKIQKSLNKYLGSKREEFPRFYFLGDEELLEILSRAKDPTLITKYMKKCFEAIEYIEFNKSLEVINMKSAEKEIVVFDTPVVTSSGANKGRVERWMNDVESQMRKTLDKAAKKCFNDTSERTKWVFNWPGQIILAVNNTRWTAGVEENIANNDIPGYLNTLISEREDIVDLVKGELTPLQRKTLGALIVIDQHAIYVVEMLIQNKIYLPDDFDWISQLRYYMRESDKHKINIEMITSRLPYQYEYLGNSDRLVITPLTDRCYRTLMGAFQYHYGGAPEGPAGTGKTETVKDLAKAIAVQCVVFNCSDQINYVAMSKFFKGLSQCGAWCCFDEFNRIEPAVLSVIAEQVRTIQQAIKKKSLTFKFEGIECKLNTSAFTCITMNPGYAGRAELPDNLKALFRPCAMMVPEYSLISEIVLFSFGYQTATNLAKKVVAALRLSSEQLSGLKHYDFGMRALKAILVAAGNLKKKYLTEDEARLCIRALYDVNLPKFTETDIPLFKDIVNDLFTNLTPPVVDYALLKQTIIMRCDKTEVMPEPVILKKCIELYETLLVRHGLMLVGETASAKTTVLNLLRDSLTHLSGQEDYIRTKDYWINPKAIDSYQLFGKLDTITKSWTDGVLAIIMKACENDIENPERKWVVFDGPVDAVWIENMNTVLDDNKILCLTNGQKITVTPQTNMMFEVENLNDASPATVSRCGMVYLEPRQLGWRPLVYAYSKYKLPKCMEHLSKFLEMTLVWMLTPIYPYVTKNCVFPFLVDNMQMTFSVLKIFDSLCRHFHDADQEDVEGREISQESRDAAEMIKDVKLGEALINNYCLFAVIWGVGGVIESSRYEFNKFMMKLIMFEKVDETYKLELEDNTWEPRGLSYNLTEGSSLFEITFDIKTNQWTSWIKTIAKWVPPTPTTPYNELIVPTSDTIRNSYLINLMIMNNHHILLTGPTGTAKTISAVNELNTTFKTPELGNLMMVFSGQTSANQVQFMIESKMSTRARKGVFRPEDGKQKMVVFIDDVNMPAKEEYGAQPPLELLRMWADHGFWYDLIEKEKEKKHFENMQLLCTMGPPKSGRNMVTRRFLRHFYILFTEPFEEKSLTTIFSSILDWYFLSMKGKLPSPIVGLKDSVVEGTIQVYNKVTAKLLPTPKKSHYIYNLRDVSRVIQGITKAIPHSFSDPNDLIKLWGHECTRVFSDRLINKDDHNIFTEQILKPVMSQVFKKQWSGIVKLEPLLFGSFIPTRYPDGDQSKPAYPNVYCELTNRENLVKTSEKFLLKYNEASANSDENKDRLNLVLFMTALEHLVRIVRILETPYGHALLVGVGGSGKKSLAKLATFIVDYDRFSIELSKEYDYKKNWPEDLQALQRKCGVDNRPTTFLFVDTQIFTESLLEDLSSILNQGEVPNLFGAEDKAKITEDLTENFPDITEPMNQSQRFDLFLRNCKKNMHLVLSFSPVGDLFRKRLMTFPSLINCTTIDWFLPWPNEALKSVALALLKGSDVPEDQIKPVGDIFVLMQEKIVELAGRYLEELRKYFYVTPTSYIELVNCFRSMLTRRSQESKAKVAKYQTGLEKIASAEVEVKDKKIELEKLTPELQESTIFTEELIARVQKEQIEADKKKEICEKDEIECNIIKDEATKMKEETQIDVDQAEEILTQCRKELEKIGRADIDELKKMGNPKDSVKLMFQALCVIYNCEVKLIKDPNDAFKKIADYITPVRNEVMKDPNKMIANLKSYDDTKISKEINQSMIDKIKHMMTDSVISKEFNKERLSTVSQAAGALFGWFQSIILVYEKLQIVNPKRDQLKMAQARVDSAESTLKQKMEELKQVAEQISTLKSQQKAAEEKKTELKNKVTVCKRQLIAAEELTAGFQSEKESWKDRAELLKTNIPFILGECLVASGVIAYLGAFPMDYRNRAIEFWIKVIKDRNIKLPEEFTLRQVCIDDLTVTEWVDKYKLPNDSISIENAIIMKESSRFPLIIDPQLQATNWLKALYAGEPKMRVLKPNMNPREMPLIIGLCINEGFPLMVENLEEAIDPMFESLYDQVKEEEKTSTGVFVRLKFMDKFLDLNPNFKFFGITKLARPHYPPEICAKVTLINFTVTPEGLQDQLVNIVMSIEQVKADKDRQAAIKNNDRISKAQVETEIKILNLLSNQEGNILDDEVLIETLNKSKRESKEAEVEMSTIKDKKKTYFNKSLLYKEVGFRVSNLFFCVMDMSNVEPMYQFSLEWFIELFKLAIVQSQTGNSNKDSRNDEIITTFTDYLFIRVCRSLFEKDKMLFSYLIYLKRLTCDQITSNSEIRKLLLNLAPKEASRAKEVSWMSDRQWNIINDLNTIHEFKGIVDDFVTYSKEFLAIYDNEQPQKSLLPGRWGQVNPIQKLIILKTLRPDKLIQAIRNEIEITLGKQFVEFETFTIDNIYKDSKSTTPIVFILSPGTDPLTDIEKLSRKQGIQVACTSLSLGQGQEKAANDAVTNAKQKGEWVVLQNCHLAPSFLSTIEKTMADPVEGEKYRLWLTSLPSNKFPVSILQNGVKVTTEPPRGIKASMNKAFTSYDNKYLEDLKDTRNLGAWKKLVFALSFFHAVILERRKFGSLGWNIPYQFSDKDMSISMSQIQTFLENYQEVEWKALHYLIAEANYGGRVTDPQDRRLIMVILKTYFTEDILTNTYKFSESGTYYAPNNGSQEVFSQYIKELPTDDDPEVFGMHTNANITSGINETNELLFKVLELQPQISDGGASSTDNLIKQKCIEIVDSLPKAFDIESAAKKFEIKYEESMNTVLQQELIRFNKLRSTIVTTLRQLEKAIEGTIIMSPELEEVYNKVYIYQVPTAWHKVSYPSLKPLTSWVDDFLKRLAFIQNWIDKGQPTSFWISGLFSTQAFLTGINQNYARKVDIHLTLEQEGDRYHRI